MYRSTKVLALLSAVVMSSVEAAPAVTSISGTIGDGQQVTITGSGFGSTGPTVVLFDDFEKGGGATGAAIPLTSPSVGSWTQYGQDRGRPRYSTFARSGTHGWRASDATQDLNKDDSNRIGQFLQVLGTSFSEAFISYAVGLPPNSTFPGSSTVGRFPGVSAWKMTWFYDGATGYGADGKADLCVPTFGGAFLIGGNDGNAVSQDEWFAGMGQDWFSFTKWTRISSWLHNGSTVGTYFQSVNEDKGYKEKNWAGRSPFPSGASTKWDRITIPGWWGNGDNANNQITYDDVYLAIGPNAAARIEIGDSATYNTAKRLAISTPTSWSNGSITANLRMGPFLSTDTLYLFVVDANNVPSAGIRLQACKDCPKPPTSANAT